MICWKKINDLLKKKINDLLKQPHELSYPQLKKTKGRATMKPYNPTSGHIYVEENMIWKDIGTPIFIAALFIIVKT